MRRRRWPWLVGGGVVFVLAVVAIFTVKRLTDPEYLRSLAEATLKHALPGGASVGSAHFSWFDGIRLQEVKLYGAPIDGSGASGETPADPMPLLAAHEVRLAPNVLAAVKGHLDIESIQIEAPVCNVVRDNATGQSNVSGLLRSERFLERSDLALILPSVELRNARVRVFDRYGGSDHLVDDVTLTIRGSLHQRGSRFYDLVWQGNRSAPEHGYTQVDLSSGRLESIRGGLPWMSIDGVMMAINAKYDGARAWTDLLGLDGRVRVTDFKIGGASAEPRSATVELQDAQLSVPIDKQEESSNSGARYLQFAHVNGTVQLTEEGIAADFEGRFHDSACKVEASLRTVVGEPKTLDDVDLNVRVSVTGLHLPSASPESAPEQIRFIQRWPGLARFYHEYDPGGVIDLELDARKEAGRDSTLAVRRILIKAVDADTSWRRFPYRVTGVSGALEITAAGARLLNLHGDHHGGRVSVNGSLDRLGRDWPGTVTVTGKSILIDDALQNALPAHLQEIRPMFTPMGKVDIDATLTISKGDVPGKEALDAATSIRFKDLTVNYEGFPYPLVDLSGAVAIHRDRLELIDATARAGDAPVTIKGHAMVAKDRPASIDFQLNAEGVAIDDALFQALPESAREQIAALDPAGRFDLATHMLREPNGGALDQNSTVHLIDASFQHKVFPERVEHVNGALTIGPDSIEFAELTGHVRGGTVTLRGSLNRSARGHDVDLEVECQGDGVANSLLSVLPKKGLAAMSDASVDGPAVATVHFLRRPDEALAVSGDVRLGGVCVQHPRMPLPFQEVTGQVAFDTSGMGVRGVEARYGDAKLKCDGETTSGANGQEGWISGEANGLGLDDSLRNLLSATARRAWDRLAPSGRVDLHVARLGFHADEVDGRLKWTIGGRATLHDATLRGLNDLKGINGTVAGQGQWVDRLGGTSLEGPLELSKLEFAGQPVEDLRGHWSVVRREDGAGLLTVDVEKGRFFDGVLAGTLRVALEQDGAAYETSLMVKGFDVTSMLGKAPAGEGKMAVQGLADLRINLSGRFGDPSSTRGGGRVAITNGPVQRFPILRAILQVIDLAVPDDHTFNQASADFYVVGETLELSDISLRGELLALVGSGTMSWPDQGLDLELVHVGPYPLADLPVLADLVEGATRTFVELHVTGPLSQPTVTARPLPAVSSELRRLFKKKPPRRPLLQNADAGG